MRRPTKPNFGDLRWPMSFRNWLRKPPCRRGTPRPECRRAVRHRSRVVGLADQRGRVTMHPFQDFCRHALDDIRARGRYRSFTALRKVAARFPVYVRPDGAEVLIWSSNDYLGMGRSPVTVDAACDAARAMGVGAGGTRNISGTNRLHEELEAELADLH